MTQTYTSSRIQFRFDKGNLTYDSTSLRNCVSQESYVIGVVQVNICNQDHLFSLLLMKGYLINAFLSKQSPFDQIESTYAVYVTFVQKEQERIKSIV